MRDLDSAPHRGFGWVGGGGDTDFGAVGAGTVGSTSFGFAPVTGAGLRAAGLMPLTVGTSLDSEPKRLVDLLRLGLDIVGLTDLTRTEGAAREA